MAGTDSKRVQIIYWVIALIVFVIFLCFGIAAMGEKVPKGKVEVVFMGDSIMAQPRDDTSVPRQVAVLTQKEIANCAMGGTAISLGKRPAQDSVTFDAYAVENMKSTLSMISLSQAIAHQDFGAQQATKAREPALDYSLYTVDTIASIDFSEVDVLLFNHGINDYHQGVEILNPADLYDEYTFAGAMRSTIETLRKEYPALRIIYVTPTFTWYHPEKMTCEEYNTGYGTLKDYVDIAITLCEEYDIEYVDAYNDLYELRDRECYDEETVAMYTVDGVHPNAYGRELLANAIAGKLAEE